MFSYIKGIITQTVDSGLVVETGGIGFFIQTPASIASRTDTGTQAKIYTSFQMREDGMSLYGFLSMEDRDMFDALLKVNGVGPKAALGILSCMDTDALRLAIATEDEKAIAKAPGIGIKTARRIILDMKDRIGNIALQSFAPADEQNAEAASSLRDAAKALVALGYSAAEAEHAVKKTGLGADADTETVLKQALKLLI